MGAAERLDYYMPEAEFLERERRSPFKHEYFQGEVRAMAGASLAHNLITDNVVMALNGRLRGQCRAVSSNLRLHVRRNTLYTYPDVTVYCGQPEFLDGEFDTLLNPSLLVEVLSPSTAAYDVGEKARRYRDLPSLRHYLVIDSRAVYVGLWTRLEEFPFGWHLLELTDPAQVLSLTGLAIELPLEEIYEGVYFLS